MDFNVIKMIYDQGLWYIYEYICIKMNVYKKKRGVEESSVLKSRDHYFIESIIFVNHLMSFIRENIP